MISSAGKTPDFETKYTLPSARAPLVASWLRYRMPRDHVPSGRVFSLYLDSDDRRSLQAATNGDYRKSKVRLRWYEPDDEGPARPGVFLEVKRKTGLRRTKLRRPIEIPERRLKTGNIGASDALLIREMLWHMGVVVGRWLRPVSLIDYERLRFFDPTRSLRVALDRDIRTSGGGGRPAWLGRAPLPIAVLETKGPRRELPEPLGALIALGLRRQSFSKFERFQRRRQAGS